ncbi:MAG TPA: AMP-binding protein [Pseudonocardia sp.]
MTAGQLPFLADVARAFSVEDSFEVLAGDPADGYNACVELCDQHVAGDGVALRWLGLDDSTETVTYEQLQRRSAQFADMLIERGARPGDRVAGLLPRRPELLTVLLGTLRAGCVYQPVFTAFGPKAIETRLAASRPVLVVTDRANRPKLAGLELPGVLVIDEEHGPESLSGALRHRPDNTAPIMLTSDAPFLMMFTSGTTGTPKGVLVPIHMLRAVWAYMRYAVGLRDDDTYWNLADPGWAYGLYYGLCGALLIGQTATMSEAPFTVERTYEVIRRFGIDNLAGAPTAFRAMAASPLAVPGPLRAISSAGEPLDPETASWLTRAFGAPARDHWGQTELGMVICDHNGLAHPRRPGTIGYTMPGWRAAILDADGKEQPAGTPGALAVDRRSGLFWFTGYDQRSEQPFIGDYYLTGDSAVMQPDGAFQFVGRDDDVITSSGYRIGPFEVESALMEHQAVAEAAVIGRPDPVRTEIVKAFVVLMAPTAPSDPLAEEISQFVKQRLAAHAYPREIEFVDELPKTPSGKVQRFLLRQQEVSRRGQPATGDR